MTVAPSWLALQLLEADLLPSPIVRAGIRRILQSRLDDEARRGAADPAAIRRQFVAGRSAGPIAIDTAAANAQHYEVPAAFYRLMLGPHMKYSSAWWDDRTPSLGEAEAAMLALSAEHATLADGQRVLELGCGWGSLSLWMARRFPASEIVGVSNSASQKTWIDGVIGQEGIRNLRIVTADMNAFEAPGTFDRVVSIEMFEHMRNWRALLTHITRWLRDDGRVFIHIFTHRRYGYPYEVRDASDWMARYFFTGGIMPSDDLLYAFDDLVQVEEHWRLSGAHYQKTADAWLDNLERHHADVRPILAATYGPANVRRWWVRWRVFLMACAELWGYRQGEEWLVSHYRLAKASRGR